MTRRRRLVRGTSHRLHLLALLGLLALGQGCASSTEEGPSDTGSPDAGGDVIDDGGGPVPTGNRAPTLARVGDKRAVVDRALIIELRASDPDGDALEYSVFGDLPDGAKFDKEAARFSWMPVADDLGTQWLITFSASDGEANDRETITITVVSSLENSPPELIDPGLQQLAVGEDYELLIEATDPDGDALFYSIVGTSPEGSEFDESKGLFTWTPETDDEDTTHRVLFEVSDGTETDDLFVDFRVGSADLRFSPIPPQEVRLGDSLSFSLEVINPADQDYDCSALGTLPAGAGFDIDACRFDWTPTDEGLVNRTTQIAFQIAFEGEEGETQLVQTASITVLPPPAGACEDDEFEADEEGGFAAPIEPGTYEGLTLCGTDDDVFSIDLVEGQQIEVRIDFEHDVLDIDLALWAPSAESEPTRISEGITDTELIRLENVPETGSWQIEVYGINPGDATYDLTITVTEVPTCEDDEYEDNDTRADAADVANDATIQGQFCLGDTDWYAFEALEGDWLTVEIVSDDEIDLDLAVHPPSDDNAPWWSLDTGPSETLVVEGLPEDGTYDLEVFSVVEEDSGYLLSLDVDHCVDDDQDDGIGNDVPSSARELVDGEVLEDRVFCDPDWYFVILGAGEGVLLAVDYDVSTWSTPTVELRGIEQEVSIGDIEVDDFGVTIYLDAAPAEDIYALGVTEADRGMAYEVDTAVFAAE